MSTSSQAIQRLLDELCVDLGFCLPPWEQTKLSNSPPPSIDAFADAVFLAEGLAPHLADKQLWKKVRAVVAKHFQYCVPDPIREDIEPLLAQLFSMGFHAVDSNYSDAAFGNYHVSLERGAVTFRLTRDRNQYIIDAPIDRLKALGIFRAFNSRDEFAKAVFTYIQSGE
jgi:hypothetical protein